MLLLQIIDVDDAFVGVADRIDHACRATEVDFRLAEFGTSLWPTPEDVRGLARRSLRAATSGCPLTRPSPACARRGPSGSPIMRNAVRGALSVSNRR